MEKILKTFYVKVVREYGRSPVTGQVFDYAEEDFVVEATSPLSAHRIAQLLSTLEFRGQEMKVFINGVEHKL